MPPLRYKLYPRQGPVETRWLSRNSSRNSRAPSTVGSVEKLSDELRPLAGQVVALAPRCGEPEPGLIERDHPAGVAHTVVRDSLPPARYRYLVSGAETPICGALLENNHARPYQWLDDCTPVEFGARGQAPAVKKDEDVTGGVVNYPTLLALTRSLRVGLPDSPTRFAGTPAVPVGSAVSTGVPSE